MLNPPLPRVHQITLDIHSLYRCLSQALASGRWSELLTNALKGQHAPVTRDCSRCRMLSLFKEAKSAHSPQLRLTLRVEQYNSSFGHHFWVAASKSLASRCTAGLPSKWDAFLCSAMFPGNSVFFSWRVCSLGMLRDDW